MDNKKYSGFVLKNIALVLMFINHFFNIYFTKFECPNQLIDDMQILLTRGSFFIFCFLLSEGMKHTRSRKNYILRLLCTAIISEIIYDYAFNNTLFYWYDQNVFFDLTMSAITICVYDYFKNNKPLQISLIILICIIDILLFFNYGIVAIVWTLTFYICGNNKKKLIELIIPVTIITPFIFYIIAYLRLGYKPYWDFIIKYGSIEACAVFLLPLIFMYNGNKGKQFSKWFYYGFYPAHLIVIKLLVDYVIKYPLF